MLLRTRSFHQIFMATFQSRYYIDCFKRLWRIRHPFTARLTKSNGSPQCICPAVTGSVTTTSSHMHFCQEEKITWHGAPWRWLHSGISPVYCHFLSLVHQIISMGVAWRQLGMIRQEGKQVIFRANAVCVVQSFSIGLKPKNLSIYASYVRRKNPWRKKSF